MSKRPVVDLDDLAVPKDDEPEAPEVVEASPPVFPDVPPPKKYAHTLSLRLTAEQYRRLRRFVMDWEEQNGSRMTHQAIIETALDDFLNQREKNA